MWWLRLPLIVNDATSEDVVELSDIHGAAFKRSWSADEIAALLRDETIFVLVARRASLFSALSPVGFVIARAAAGEAEILTIAVKPASQRGGIGRELVESLLRKLYAERIGELFLEVDEANTAALALYRRLGFREVGERTGYYRDPSGNRSTALVMRRDLR